MATPRFHCPHKLHAGQALDLPAGAAHHAARVLRLRVGETVTLFNGAGGEYAAVIDAIDRERVRVTVERHMPLERESPLKVTLIQGVSARERMDIAIQKAVELGVERIAPVMTERSIVRLSGERADNRVRHWQQVVIAACEQCGRNRVPAVDALLPFVTWLDKTAAAGARWMLHPDAEHPLRELREPVGPIELLVGPEGGLTAAEIAAAIDAGFTPVRLGPRILRTETAAPALLAAAQALWGDF
ncbi:MAG TPA: 16S rRNA (uracil(1498)-N(3))-methyltransferase [Acidiferrobacterales bacterium]